MMVLVLLMVPTLSTFLMAVSSMSNIMPMITMDMLLMSLMKELLHMPTLLLTQLPMLLPTQLFMLLPTQLLMLLLTLLFLAMVLLLDMELLTLVKISTDFLEILFILGHIYSDEDQRLKYRKS